MFKPNHVSKTLCALVVTSTTFAAAGCDTAPFDGTVYTSENTDRTIEFEGYSTRQSGVVRLQAKNQSTNQWETFAITVADADSALAADYWVGSPALYPWSIDAQLVRDASELDRWQPNTTAEVRIQEWDGDSWNSLYVYGSSSELGCMLGKNGEPYAGSYVECTDKASAVLHLVDVD